MSFLHFLSALVMRQSTYSNVPRINIKFLVEEHRITEKEKWLKCLYLDNSKRKYLGNSKTLFNSRWGKSIHLVYFVF